MNRFEEPPYDGFDFQIIRFIKNEDGSAWISVRCDNGAQIEATLKRIIDENDPLIEGYVSVTYKRLGSSGDKFVEPSNSNEITVKDGEECIRLYIQESMDLG